MEKKSSRDIRKIFLNYFKSLSHEIIPSSSLIPQEENSSLLFTNSGMVQFKEIFINKGKKNYPSIATVQKCLRVGGKHNDLDNVGYTNRHHTFFEMLGNFSFGQYFKSEAIEFSWNLIIKEFRIPKEKLLITVFSEDEETYKLWRTVSSLPSNRIIRISTNDNFWSMGELGPCGPCTEIFYDNGKNNHFNSNANIGDNERFLEFWNLVFMQFNQLPNGKRSLLPSFSVDTGMGLERITSILQGVKSNYDTDLFKDLVSSSIELSKNPLHIFSHRVIADHIRAIAFLISDGVLPSNDGRGYVLRRIIRRAIRHAHIILKSKKELFLYKMVPVLENLMGEDYPELIKSSDKIISILKLEEEKFYETLDRGLNILNLSIKNLNNGSILSGKLAFRLYDTYGFPLDLTQDILKLKGIHVNVDEFNKEMNTRKLVSKESWFGFRKNFDSTENELWFDLLNKYGPTEFIGYDNQQCTANVISIIDIHSGKELNILNEGESAWLVTNQTPFYGESGGQIGDIGVIKGIKNDFICKVIDTKRKAGGKLIVHNIQLTSGEIKVSCLINMKIDESFRNKVKANHSATHLLHSVLKKVIGNEISQKGSLVTDEFLRFDFSCSRSLAQEEFLHIEVLINDIITKNYPIVIESKNLKEISSDSSIAIFRNKYEQNVRVVSINNYDGNCLSSELCGGTHSQRTGDIGIFKIISTSSISSGVRRIYAKTGEAMLQEIDLMQSILNELSKSLGVKPIYLIKKVRELIKDNREFTKKINNSQIILNNKEKGDKDLNNLKIQIIGNFKVIEKKFSNIDYRLLKPMIDRLKRYIDSGIIIISNLSNINKISLIIGITDNLIEKVNAIDLLKVGIKVLDPINYDEIKVGGRLNLAQTGGKGNEETIDSIHDEIKKWISNI